MKVLVTGALGQLGTDAVKALDASGIPNKGADIDDFDISGKGAVFEFIRNYAPDAVIHCAAYAAVDKAEDEPEVCRLANEEGTRNIALACKEARAKMLYISTDYVFDGRKDEPYNVNDTTNPLSVYGKTKLLGERAVIDTLEKYFIVRISWVFGDGNNFVKTMLRLGNERDTVNVVCDQVGSPTYTKDLSKLLCDMVLSDKYGIYHATNEGFCSWAEFAAEIFSLANSSTKVNPISTAQYPTKAQRPQNSRLCKSSLDAAGFSRLPHWKDAIERYLKYATCRV